MPPVNTVYERNPYQGNYPSYGSQPPPTAHYPAPPPQASYMPGSAGQGPPSYQATGYYPTQQQQQQQPPQGSGYMPGSTSNNAYSPQYPSVPGQMAGGYVPQSNSTYPNIPTYEDATRKHK